MSNTRDSEEDEGRPLLGDSHQPRRTSDDRSSPQLTLRRLSSGAVPPYDLQENDEDHSPSASVTIWTVVPVLLLGVFVSNADSSLVVASSSKIAGDFRALSEASWLITSYALAQCAAQPLYGKLSDIFGRKSNLAVAYVLFSVGCLICGVGQSYWQVIAGRAVSGTGSAGMTALVSIIITDMVPVRQIASWRSYVNLIATLGRSLGGPLGGLLTDTAGWRATFNVQVPLTLLGLLLVLCCLSDRPKNPCSEHEQSADFATKIKRVDFAGAVSLACAISGVLMIFEFLAKSAPWWQVLAAGILAVLTSSAFYLVETRYAREPILPMHLLIRADLLTSYALVSFQIAAQFGMFYVVPIYFRITAGESVSQAGLRLVPAVVGNAIGGILSGIVVAKTGRYKYLTVSASAVATIGYALILVRWRGSTPWPELTYFFLGGFGMGIIQSTTYIHLAGNLEVSEMAIAGTTLYLAQNVWVLIGIQVTTFVLRASLRINLDRALVNVPEKTKIIEQSLQSITLINMLPEHIRRLVVTAYVDSMRNSFGLSVALASIGLLIGLAMKEKRI